MIKTASTGPVELHSSPSAYYLWEFPEKPVSVRLSLDVVDRLERDVLESFRAITARGSEVGGILLGRAEVGTTLKTVIENYELFHCDYSRGPLYLLSDEEKARLEDVIRRKKAIPGQAGAVVGFFRSNTRKDLALDDEDLAIYGEYFSRPEQAFLLVKPYAAKASVGGLFIWESGKVRTEGSYIEFPFRRADLGKGEFAKSIVLDAPKPKETAAEPAPPATVHKSGSRAPVLPFSLKRDEEPPVAAPPLKREARAPVVAFSQKVEELEEPPAPPVREAVEPAPALLKPAAEAAPARKPVEKPSPALPPLRQDFREEREKKVEAVVPAKPQPKVEKPESKAPAPPPKVEKPESKAPAPPPPPAPAVEPAPAESVIKAESLPIGTVFGGKKLWALFGGLAMLGLAAGTLYYLKSASASPTAVSVREEFAFQLKAERFNGQLLVTWNRDASLIKTAQSAVLSISDGAKTEDVPLDLAQLHAGSVVYSPLSADVRFRLEVKDGKSGKSRSEYIRIPLTSMPDPAAPSKSSDAGKTPQQPQNSTPSQVAEASRVDPVSQPDGAGDQPKPVPVSPPKPFSLAARVHQPDPADLPEAPSVNAGGAAVAVRPAVPSRLPAPPPVAPPPPQAQVPAATPAAAVAQPPVRLGGKVQEPKLLRKVDAIYPPMARQARVGGVVRIQATIGKDGKVRKLEVLSGPPLLKQAALDAVQKWVYSPSLLNGSPVEATTDIDVSFSLNGR